MEVRTAGPSAGWVRSPRLIATCPTASLLALDFRPVGPDLADPLRGHINRAVDRVVAKVVSWPSSMTDTGLARGNIGSLPLAWTGLGYRNPPATHIRATLGYAGCMRFEAGELALLDETEEIEIETAAPGSGSHRTTIWVVVDGGDAFVRSVNGSSARWYREAVANPAVTVHAGGRELAARVVSAADPDSVRQVNDGLTRKYTGITGLREMLEPDIFETTLRLEPA